MTRLWISLLLVLMPSAQSTFRITGHVSTTGDPGQTLARAYVSLIGVESKTHRLTMTRDDGAFVFEGLAAGSYIVEAGKLPHVATQHLVTLGPSQAVADLTFRLKRSGVITGHVFDERGAPAREVTVNAREIRYERGGEVTAFSTGSSSVTDRFGGFRLHGLAPGAYVVTTRLGGALGMAVSFLPGVAGLEGATRFFVDDGTEYTNVSTHLVLPVTPTTQLMGTVSGVVLDPDGRPVEADVTVGFLQTATGSMTGSMRTRSTGGRFRFNTVPSSASSITATVAGQALQGTHYLTPADVRGGEIALQLQPPIHIVGRATDANGLTTPATLLVVNHNRSNGEILTIDVPPSGEFRLSLFPGRYLIPNPSLVLVDGVDMTDRVFEVRHDPPIKSLVVTFAGPRQSISGRVLNSDGVGVNTVTMVAFSATETDWFHDSRRIAIATPSTDGRYELPDPRGATLPAGDYYLAAVAELSPDEHYNPAFLKTLIPAALRITLGAGEQKVQDVRVR